MLFTKYTNICKYSPLILITTSYIPSSVQHRKDKISNPLQRLTPDSNVHGANMGPTWGRQDPGGPHVGPMNLAIWDISFRQQGFGRWVSIIMTLHLANERHFEFENFHINLIVQLMIVGKYWVLYTHIYQLAFLVIAHDKSWILIVTRKESLTFRKACFG